MMHKTIKTDETASAKNRQQQTITVFKNKNYSAKLTHVPSQI